MAGNRRRPGSNQRPLLLAAVAVILVGLVLVSLRLVPGSPLRRSAPPRTRPGRRGRSTDAPTDRSSRARADPDADPLAGAAAVPGPGARPRHQGLVRLERAGQAHRRDHRLEEHGRDQHHRLDDQVVDRRRLPAPRRPRPGRPRATRSSPTPPRSSGTATTTRAEQFYNERRPGRLDQAADPHLRADRQQVASDGGWSRTRLSARDTARLGACIDDGRAAGPKWTKWLLNEMRLVRGVGDFGIRKAFPAAEQKTIAIKNGWIDRHDASRRCTSTAWPSATTGPWA